MLAMARFFLSKGAVQFTKRYGAKALKEVKKYITKNKLIWDGKKVIEKTTKIKPKVNPRIKNSNKKPDVLNKKADDIINKVKNSPDDGEKLLNNLDKSGNLFNFYIKGKFKNNRVFKKSIKDTLNNKNIKNNTTKKIDDTKLTSKVNTPKSSNALSLILGKAQKHPFTAASILAVPTYTAVKKVSDLMKDMGGKTEAKTFGQAFREARKEKGPDAVFTYKGKQYSTVTEDQYKKAGFNSLREYLNAKKKK